MMVFEDEKISKDNIDTDDEDHNDREQKKNLSLGKSLVVAAVMPFLSTNAGAMFGEERPQEDVLYTSGFMRTIFSGSLTYDICEKANLNFSTLSYKKNAVSKIDCEQLKQKISNTLEYLEEGMSNLPKEDAVKIVHSLKILRENLGLFDIAKTGSSLMSAIAKVDSYVLY